MKFDEEHVRRVKRLWQQLRKGGGHVHLPPVEDPMDQLLEGVFSNYAAESRAHAAVNRLRATVVDLNELRVTPVAEIVEIVGPDFPMCRASAEELNRTMLSLFNRTHKTDLKFLTKQSRRGAETFLNRLDGLGAYTKATILQRCFKAPVVPVDYTMLHFLRKSGCVPADASVEGVQKFLSQQVRESDAMTFYVLLKRHAAAHAPRKLMEYHPVAATAAGPAESPAEPGDAAPHPDSHARPHPPAPKAGVQKAHPARPPKKKSPAKAKRSPRKPSGKKRARR
jgi:endonuclease III